MFNNDGNLPFRQFSPLNSGWLFEILRRFSPLCVVFGPLTTATSKLPGCRLFFQVWYTYIPFKNTYQPLNDISPHSGSTRVRHFLPSSLLKAVTLAFNRCKKGKWRAKKLIKAMLTHLTKILVNSLSHSEGEENSPNYTQTFTHLSLNFERICPILLENLYN